MPIVTVPFIMAIMGFRSTEKSVIMGMLAGFITVISWDYLWQIKIINSVFIGMVSNLIFLIGSLLINNSCIKNPILLFRSCL